MSSSFKCLIVFTALAVCSCPGDLYRVSWWNGKGWTVHCEVEAKDVELQIEDIPADKLYYIEGLSRGIQNRVFVYDSDISRLIWQ